MTSQAYADSAQGAQAGYKVGGAWGAVIGAVVGAGAGLIGDKAAKYRRQATAEEQRAVEIKQSEQRRSLVRNIFLARSQALAAGAAQETGGLQSSAVQGTLSSISEQGISNLKTFDALIARQVMQQYYLKKAKKKQGQSDAIMGLIQGVGGSGGGMGMGGGGGGGSSGYNNSNASTFGTDNSTASWVSDFGY